MCSPQPPQTSLDLFRTAMALNNAGVSLLERGRYAHAITAFRDSLSAMKSAFAFHSGCEASLGCSHFDPTETLHETIAFLSTSNAKFPAGGVQVVACEDGDISFLIESLYLEPTSSTFFPLRTRYSPTDLSIERDFDIPSVTILYNHALAHLLAFGHAESPKTFLRTKFLTGAFRSLCSANSILSQMEFVPDDPFQKLRIMLTHGLVLNRLLLVLRYMDMRLPAAEVWDSLHELVDEVEEHHDILRSMNVLPEHDTAAAAA